MHGRMHGPACAFAALAAAALLQALAASAADLPHGSPDYSGTTVHVVFSNHVDIGFDGIDPQLGTDDNVINKYFDRYFPKAVSALKPCSGRCDGAQGSCGNAMHCLPRPNKSLKVCHESAFRILADSDCKGAAEQRGGGAIHLDHAGAAALPSTCSLHKTRTLPGPPTCQPPHSVSRSPCADAGRRTWCRCSWTARWAWACTARGRPSVPLWRPPSGQAPSPGMPSRTTRRQAVSEFKQDSGRSQ